MQRLRIGPAVLAMCATLLLAGGVSASQSEPVTITILTTIGAPENQFEATGAGVCPEGTVSNLSGNFVGGQSGRHAQIILFQRFDCDDGTFDALLRVTLDFATGDTAGTWSVLDGTGAYETLHGHGSLTGDSVNPGTILDVYVGSVHFN